MSAPAQLVDLVFSVPNEDDAVGVDHVTLGIPPDFELDDAEAKAGLDAVARRAGGHVVGRPDPEGHVRALRRSAAPLRSTSETVLFNVLVGDRTGKSITYRVALDVSRPATSRTPARARSRRRRSSSRSLPRRLALAALFVAALPLAPAAPCRRRGGVNVQAPCCSSGSSSTTISAAPRTSSATASAGVAVVVDPAFAIEQYLEAAAEDGVRIERVLETHTHADHLSGHGRFALEHGVPVAIHPLAEPEFPSTRSPTATVVSRRRGRDPRAAHARATGPSTARSSSTSASC